MKPLCFSAPLNAAHHQAYMLCFDHDAGPFESLIGKVPAKRLLQFTRIGKKPVRMKDLQAQSPQGPECAARTEKGAMYDPGLGKYQRGGSIHEASLLHHCPQGNANPTKTSTFTHLRLFLWGDGQLDRAEFYLLRWAFSKTSRKSSSALGW